jgi:hypothetical protein
MIHHGGHNGHNDVAYRSDVVSVVSFVVMVITR